MFARIGFVLCACVAICIAASDDKSAQTITVQQLRDYVNGPSGYYATQFKGVFYAGTKGGYDHIVVRYITGTGRPFKLRVGGLAIKRRMKIEHDEEKWVNITPMFPAPR